MVTLTFRPAVSYMPALSAKLLWKEKRWRLATPADSHSAHTMAGTHLLTRCLICPSDGTLTGPPRGIEMHPLQQALVDSLKHPLNITLLDSRPPGQMHPP